MKIAKTHGHWIYLKEGQTVTIRCSACDFTDRLRITAEDPDTTKTVIGLLKRKVCEHCEAVMDAKDLIDRNK